MAIDIFEENHVDPWYTQSILLIESPAKISYSNAGAYGPFQLMKKSQEMGLTVNNTVDESMILTNRLMLQVSP